MSTLKTQAAGNAWVVPVHLAVGDGVLRFGVDPPAWISGATSEGDARSSLQVGDVASFALKKSLVVGRDKSAIRVR